MKISEFFGRINNAHKQKLKEQPGDLEKAYNCTCCSELFIPRKGQWIFHNLCDLCFDEFDHQKMERRFASLEGKESKGTESVEEWIASRSS